MDERETWEIEDELALEVLAEPQYLRPISGEEYDRMVDLGMFEGEHVELLCGFIVYKPDYSKRSWPESDVSPQGREHSDTIVWLNRELVLQTGRSYEVRPQLPFAARGRSRPEPDLGIAEIDPKLRTHPDALLLAIEVAVSSRRRDRTVKLELYARAGVPEYWIVDPVGRTVEVYMEPRAKGYAHSEVMRDGDVLRPTKVPGITIAVAEIPR